MEIRTIKKYSKINLGYYLDKPEPVTGGYDRAITLIDGANDSRYTGASYIDDDWFKFIAGSSANKSTFITFNPNGVNKCLKANSRLDDDILKRYGYRVLFADLLLDYKELGEEVGKELLNEELADRVKELFETKREAYNRIFEVINEEYEPLYNLDVTYEEQHSGTDSTGSSGSNTSSLTRTGDDSLKRTGTEKLANAGSEAMTYAGSEKTAYAGSESMSYAGSEKTAYAGSESMSYAGSEITADGTGSQTVTNNSVYAFNSVDPVPESHSETLHEKSESKTYENREDTKSFNDREDTKSFTNREDTKSFEDREDTKSFQNRTDTKSFNNREDTTTYNTTDKTEYNSGQSTSGSHTDTGTFTHGEKIVTRRYGNQGITKSTELLIDQINTWTNIDFIHYVADEIARQISTI